MLHRQIEFERVAPWLVSGASGLYVVARARRLSRSSASYDSWSDFLIRQSDVILLLCGSPIVWYVTKSRRKNYAGGGASVANSMRQRSVQSPTHQLRQVFTALLIGTGLLIRKASESKNSDILRVALRLNKVVRDGVDALVSIDELRLGELLDGDRAVGDIAVLQER